MIEKFKYFEKKCSKKTWNLDLRKSYIFKTKTFKNFYPFLSINLSFFKYKIKAK